MDDPVATQVLVHAFNQWMYDEWGFEHQGRIFTTPVMNLATAEGAVNELEWALERGAKTVLVRPAPVAGFKGPKSPFLPYADPFWKLIEEANIPVMLHASDSGYTKYTNDWNGSDQEYRPFESRRLLRPVDVAAADRWTRSTPRSATGCCRASPACASPRSSAGARGSSGRSRSSRSTYGKMPQLFAEHPLDALNRALYIAPYWEDPLEPLIETIGLDHILFNSDWPHPEGLADPNEYALYARDEVGLADARPGQDHGRQHVRADGPRRLRRGEAGPGVSG